MEEQARFKRLYKSRTERMIDGVCGGIAEYFGFDPTLIRIGMVLLAFAGGVGILIYLVGMIIMPTNPSATPAPHQAAVPRTSAGYHRFWGILLVVLGLLWFMGNMGWDFWHHWWWFTGGMVFPVLLILAGVAFLFGGRNYVSQPAAPADGVSVAPADAPASGPKRFYKSRSAKKIFGVCAGLGEYFEVDPVIVRILFVVAAFASFGFVLLAYVLLAIVVPFEPMARPAQ